jgi:hypothetical protein
MRQLLEKAFEIGVSAVGGFLSGVLGSVFLSSHFLQLFYQEGWYAHLAPYLFIPAIVLLVYCSALAVCSWQWRFAAAGLLIAPVFVGYIVANRHFPLSVDTAWIEFSLFWTMIAQIAAISLVGAWELFWRTYDRVQPCLGGTATDTPPSA